MHAYETKDHIVLANNLCKIGKKKTPPLIKGTNIATKKIYKEIIKKEYQSASAQQPPLHVSKKKTLTRKQSETKPSNTDFSIYMHFHYINGNR